MSVPIAARKYSQLMLIVSIGATLSLCRTRSRREELPDRTRAGLCENESCVALHESRPKLLSPVHSPYYLPNCPGTGQGSIRRRPWAFASRDNYAKSGLEIARVGPAPEARRRRPAIPVNPTNGSSGRPFITRPGNFRFVFVCDHIIPYSEIIAETRADRAIRRPPTVLPMRISHLCCPVHLHLSKDALSRTVASRLVVEGVRLLRTKPCAGRLNYVVRTQAGLTQREGHPQ